MDLPPDFLLYIAAGFVAQLIDGALGMAYGVSASSLLMAFGVPPAATSATVHAAECFTTGASASRITRLAMWIAFCFGGCSFPRSSGPSSAPMRFPPSARC
jgi:uncharacterized membrane protein YfcA